MLQTVPCDVFYSNLCELLTSTEMYSLLTLNKALRDNDSIWLYVFRYYYGNYIKDKEYLLEWQADRDWYECYKELHNAKLTSYFSDFQAIISQQFSTLCGLIYRWPDMTSKANLSISYYLNSDNNITIKLDEYDEIPKGMEINYSGKTHISLCYNTLCIRVLFSIKVAHLRLFTSGKSTFPSYDNNIIQSIIEKLFVKQIVHSNIFDTIHEVFENSNINPSYDILTAAIHYINKSKVIL